MGVPGRPWAHGPFILGASIPIILWCWRGPIILCCDSLIPSQTYFLRLPGPCLTSRKNGRCGCIGMATQTFNSVVVGPHQGVIGIIGPPCCKAHGPRDMVVSEMLKQLPLKFHLCVIDAFNMRLHGKQDEYVDSWQHVLLLLIKQKSSS